ncbi:MAG: hypothetical protein CSA75_05535, partial [Sorangium cellulosum]
QDGVTRDDSVGDMVVLIGINVVILFAECEVDEVSVAAILVVKFLDERNIGFHGLEHADAWSFICLTVVRCRVGSHYAYSNGFGITQSLIGMGNDAGIAAIVDNDSTILTKGTFTLEATTRIGRLTTRRVGDEVIPTTGGCRLGAAGRLIRRLRSTAFIAVAEGNASADACGGLVANAASRIGRRVTDCAFNGVWGQTS